MGMPAALLAVMGIAFFSAGASPPPALNVAGEGDSIWIRHGDAPLLRYRFDGVPFKPYVQEWYSPARVQVLRDAPHDHLHHHAMMYAIKVDGVNFWEEREAPGRQVHRAFDGLKTGERGGVAFARFTQHVDWTGPDSGEPLLQEARTITVFAGPSPALLTWESHFTVPPGREKATLGGSHYHGLGMRFVESMDTVGAFTTPGGELGELVRGDEHLTPGAWCAYTAPAGERPVTVAMFDAPGNVRPALWFTMKEHFAYLSATINLWREPLDVTPDTPLVITYGAALWDGEIGSEEIEVTYQRWLALEQKE